jgi:hypothetical protein
VVLVFVLTSQPLLCLLPSQSANPGLHVPPQTAALHEGVMLFDEHTIPHAPQFETLFETLVSHPFVRLLPSQSLKAGAQVPVQLPPVHDGVMLFDEQAAPQAPQCATVLVILTSQPSNCLLLLQSPKPEAHAPLHTPPEHERTGTFVDEQTVAHPPQLLMSVATLVSQPSF